MRDPEDKKEFASILQATLSIYGQAPSKVTMQLWWNVLIHYDIAAVRDAFSRYVANPDDGQFAPKPASIVRMIEGGSVDASMAAWVKVEQSVQRIGAYADVVFDDPIIHRVIDDMGGWPKLCGGKVDEWPFIAKEFQTRYQGIRSQRNPVEYPRILIGIAGAHNRGGGYQVSPPVLIGDEGAAKAVLAAGIDRPMVRMRQMAEALEGQEWQKLNAPTA